MPSISPNQRKNPFSELKTKNFISNVLERTAQSGSDEDWNYFLNDERVLNSPKFNSLRLLASIIHGVSIGKTNLDRAIGFLDIFGEKIKSESSDKFLLNNLANSLLLPTYNPSFNKDTVENEAKIFHKLIELDSKFLFLENDKRPLLAKFQYQIMGFLENGILELMPLLVYNFDLIKKYSNQDEKEIFNKEFVKNSMHICNSFQKISLILDEHELFKFNNTASNFFEGFKGPLPTDIFFEQFFSEKYTNLLLNKADFSFLDNSSWSVCRYDKFWEANFKNNRLSYVPNRIVKTSQYNNYGPSTILTDFQKRFDLDYQTKKIIPDVFLDRVGKTLVHAITSPDFKANLKLYAHDLDYGFKNFKLPFNPQRISKDFVLGMALKSMIEEKSEIVFPQILEGKEIEDNAIQYVLFKINDSELFKQIASDYVNVTANSSGLLKIIVEQINKHPVHSFNKSNKFN